MSEFKEHPKDGDKIKCKHYTGGLVYRDGAWEWDRETTES